jgi:hypothetical protein
MSQDRQSRKISALLGHIFKEIVRQKKWALMPVWILAGAIALFFFLSASNFLIPAIYLGF